MVRRYYELPSLTALAIFEASARHLSFKLAASELNVTPSAVSRQIKALEGELEVSLFTRDRTKISLTMAGEQLYGVLSSGFSRASQTVRTIKQGGRPKNVTLASTQGLGTMWLMPRMQDFWERYPEISVDHFMSDNARDYKRADVDLSLRYALGPWQGDVEELLFHDTIYPVCGPGYYETHGDVTAEILPELPLLHYNCLEPDWCGWEEVFQRLGIQFKVLQGRKFNKYFTTIQAALANQGIAIGLHRLVAPLIDEGKLLRITDLTLPAPGDWFISWSDKKALSPEAEVLRSWLIEISENERCE